MRGVGVTGLPQRVTTGKSLFSGMGQPGGVILSQKGNNVTCFHFSPYYNLRTLSPHTGLTWNRLFPCSPMPGFLMESTDGAFAQLEGDGEVAVACLWVCVVQEVLRGRDE